MGYIERLLFQNRATKTNNPSKPPKDYLGENEATNKGSCAEVTTATSEKPRLLSDPSSKVVLFNLNTHDPNRRLPGCILVVSWAVQAVHRLYPPHILNT